jgi:hypothetical protein
MEFPEWNAGLSRAAFVQRRVHGSRHFA